MAVYDLEEQEQLDDLKAWWAQYGKYVGMARRLVALIVFGVPGLALVPARQAAQASVLYQAVSAGRDAIATWPRPRSRRRSSTDTYGGSAYAPRGGVALREAALRRGRPRRCRAQLQWVVDHASEEELKAIARFRLAAGAARREAITTRRWRRST